MDANIGEKSAARYEFSQRITETPDPTHQGRRTEGRGGTHSIGGGMRNVLNCGRSRWISSFDNHASWGNRMSDDMQAWLAKLQQGDSHAAQRIWEEYFQKLVRLARRRMASLPRRAADEEDLALSAMNSFVSGAQAGRFPRLDDETELWQLLVVITARKVSAQRRRHFAVRRNRGQVRGESIFVQPGDSAGGVGIGDAEGNEPTPAFAAQVAEECQVLLSKLDDPLLREIAQWKMEGFSNEEIAERLGRNVRTVERKLALIRDCWSAAE
jgi:DNA-directed RNA polymerase specialized sigma24 family protein